MNPLVTGVAQIPHCCVLRSVQQAAGSMEGRPPRSAPTGQCRQDQPGRFRFSFRSAPLFPWLVHKSGIKIIVFHSAPSRPTQLVAWEANEAKLSRAWLCLKVPDQSHLFLWPRPLLKGQCPMFHCVNVSLVSPPPHARQDTHISHGSTGIRQ